MISRSPTPAPDLSASPLNMAATEDDLRLKCLELSQALVNQGKTFKLSVIMDNFSFSLESKGTSCKEVERKRKKLSPSQLRRNQKRKEDFLKKKSENSSFGENIPEKNPENTTSGENIPEEETEPELAFKCDLCEKMFRTDHGLSIHKGKSHGTEVLRFFSNTHDASLKVSPVKDAPREEEEEEETKEEESANEDEPPHKCPGMRCPRKECNTLPERDRSHDCEDCGEDMLMFPDHNCH